MTGPETHGAPWTGEELDRLRALEGLPPTEIANRLGRGVADVEERLHLIHMVPKVPSHGPDEEGEVPPPRAGRLRDPAAWVHLDPARRDSDVRGDGAAGVDPPAQE